jgi:hypothetical protein
MLMNSKTVSIVAIAAMIALIAAAPLVATHRAQAGGWGWAGIATGGVGTAAGAGRQLTLLFFIFIMINPCPQCILSGVIGANTKVLRRSGVNHYVLWPSLNVGGDLLR